jgi:hypothetical protein
MNTVYGLFQEYILPFMGPIFFVLLWFLVRSKLKSFRQSSIENQNDMLELLEEIRDEIKKQNKFNEDYKKSNYRL